ncbi:MAG: type II toxin-antitoxin system Phd/YefM family antitoxin [Phycisphaera sp.]|nr:MAG: type II toxin-antitoxin system Phd/YefM family antitoxin [Phycisphaera sp.]
METINIHEAKTHLSRLLQRAARGEEFIIAKAGKPIAKLVGFRESHQPRTGGHWKGLVRIGEDFDAPLPDEVDQAFRGPAQ